MGLKLPPQVVAAGAAADAAVAALAVSAGEVNVTDTAQTQPEATSTPPQEVTTPPTSTTPTESAGVRDEWEARYKALQGKYNAEVPALQSANKQLTDAVSGLTERVEQLLKSPQQPATAASVVTPDVSEADRDEFGADLVALIERIATAKAKAACSALEVEFRKEAQLLVDKLNTTERHVSNVQGASFAEKLAGAITDFDKRNADPAFLAWLNNEVEGYSGQLYGALLQDAAASRDVARVARIFDTYWGSSKTPETHAPESTPVVSSTLEAEVAPAAARGTGQPPSSSTAKKVWTDALIGKFYADLQRNKYKGREAEAIAIEQDIFAARQEGRYRPA